MTIARKRVFLLSVVIGGCFALVVGRLFVIQVIEADSYAERSRSQSQQRIVMAAPRGTIFDAKGRALAQTAGRAAGSDVSGLQSETRRTYPHGELAGSVLGCVGRDGYGLGGVEFAFDRYLRGEDGWAIIQRDGRNNRYRKKGLPQRDPVQGCRVYLTLDIGIQRIAQAVLKQAVAGLGAKGGMCLVMDPSSGRILAMADEPAFNPNTPARYPLAQRQNRCINHNYEPGSTFKVITAASALQERIVSEEMMIDGGNGMYLVHNEAIRDRRPFGMVTFAEALSLSSNVCFARVADKVGNDRLYRYVRDFGFGAPSGVRLPGEERGIVHPITQWSGRTRVTMAIGQELSVTLLQMTTAFAAVANGGVLLKPRICERIVNQEGATVYEDVYTPVRRVVTEDVSRRLRSVLRDVVDKGTGRAAALQGTTVAGKTGTSQKTDPATGTYFADRYWSSFIGFVPAEEPVLLCGIVIDEPGMGQSGGEAAAPAFRNTIGQIISSPELDYAELILRPRPVPAQPASQPARVAASPAAQPDPPAAPRRPHVAVMSADTAAESLSVPNVVGSDLFAAITTIAGRGLLPYVKGSGLVRAQAPLAGTLMRPAEVCTVFCSPDPVAQAVPPKGRG